ncbi:MAG: YeeE/YedE thiosulfate transporter family protein [Gammaproteobacteria bacterium]
MEIVLAIFLGTLFGFVLHRVGASNPENIINMLRLTDLHLMKTILFAIGLSSSALFLGMAVGLIDPGHLSVKGSFNGVLLGGALLGLGLGSVGYCPGTGLAAMGDGRRDAVAFVFGGLAGAFAYMLTYPAAKATGLLDPIAGGKSTLAATGNESYVALVPGVPGWMLALGIGILLMGIAWVLPGRPGSGSRPLPHGVPASF